MKQTLNTSGFSAPPTHQIGAGFQAKSHLQSTTQVTVGGTQIPVLSDGAFPTAQEVAIASGKFIVEGVDHYKNLFSFTQRKVEFENYRFKYPSLIALVIESINVKIIENQKVIGKFFYRFHVSEDLVISELADILKFKINTKIRDEEDKLGPKERMLFFNNRLSVSETYTMKDLYEKCHESDGWLYLDFMIDSIVV